MVLLTLFAWMVFWEVKETISGERSFFLVRWMYANKSYSKNIEVLPYVLTNEQVSYMLLHPNEEIQQPTNQALFNKNVNVVLRIRNRTNTLTWGKLYWTMYKKEWKEVDVIEIPMPGDNPKYSDIIIPIGSYALKNDELPDPIEIKWKEFYRYW